MIKIILADDHQMFVEGVEALLKVKEEFSVIAKAQNGQDLLHLLQKHSPDVLLLDINMPKLDGVEVMKHIKDSKRMIKVIILSTYNDFSLTKNLLQMGIMGYLPKTVSFDELITAIEKVHLGEVVIHKDILLKLQLKEEHLDKYDTFIKKYHLTKRELEVLQLIAQEKTTEEIADIACLSAYTIAIYRKNLLKKLDVKNTAGMIRIAMENEII